MNNLENFARRALRFEHPTYRSCAAIAAARIIEIFRFPHAGASAGDV
jgi:hypothetical protein